MLDTLPPEIILLMTLKLEDIYALTQLSSSSKRLLPLITDDEIWRDRLQKDFAGLESFHGRVEKAKTHADLLENYGRMTANPQQIAAARARIPSPEDFYKYLTLAHIGLFVSQFTYTGVTPEEQQSLAAMRTWFAARKQQDFRRIDDDMRQVYMPVMRILLREGLRTNSDSNQTLLQTAIYWSYVGAARLFIRYGQNINFPEGSTETPLTAAAKLDTPFVLKDLLKKGADCKKIADYGWSPLMVAAYRNHMEAAKALVKAGASPVQGGRYPTETPLSFARKQKHQEMITFLEEAADAEIAKNQLPFANGF
jgi:hypothetical protein